MADEKKHSPFAARLTQNDLARLRAIARAEERSITMVVARALAAYAAASPEYQATLRDKAA